jgi:mannose-6-phosphate isomerase-like protein (cupin superfamily)
MDITVVRKKEARVFMDGPELCREYLKTGKITFGSSTLLPGQRGEMDPGHPDSHEVFFVSRGRVVLHVPDKNLFYELEEQDIILMPEGVPHTLINVGEEIAVITWSMAPSQK